MSKDIQCLIDEADLGDVEAMVNVADCYLHGWYVEQDDVKANKYYKMAADKGNAGASFMYGLGYLTGEGVEKDMRQAVKYIRYAAEKDYANAQYIMGTLYYNEEAYKYLQDNKKVYYFTQAAKQGHAKAQLALGNLYIIEEEDLNEGLFWLVCAYMQDNSPEESSAAKDRIDTLVNSGMPGGKARVEQVMAEVRKKYPQYIGRTTIDNADNSSPQNANNESVIGLLGIIGIIVIVGFAILLKMSM